MTPELQNKLDTIAQEVRTKLREAGFRVVEVGLKLLEARKLLGPGKAFEVWCLEKLSLSQATAYRWTASAQRFLDWGLATRPDLLDEVDFAELLAPSFPATFANRVTARFNSLSKAEGEAAESLKEVTRETRKLEKALEELTSAEVAETEAKGKAGKILQTAQAKAEEVSKGPKADAEAVRSKVSDLRERIKTAREKAEAIRNQARAKVLEAQGHVKAVSRSVALTQEKATEAAAAVTQAAAAVKTEAAAAVTEGKGKRALAVVKGKGKAAAPAGTWAGFVNDWLSALYAKAEECFPGDVPKQAENLRAAAILLANKVASLSSKAKAA